MALRWLAGGVLVVCSIAATLWLVLQWGILPRIERWRPDIEVRASAALGVPVRIGAIEAPAGGRWRWAHALELRDVRLIDPASGAEALRLPRVRAAVSPAALLPQGLGPWRPRLEQLLVDGAELDVRRDRAGRLRVAGLALGGGDAAVEGASAADWFFGLPEFAIRGGRLTWTDELRAQPPLALAAVDLVVRNNGRHHALRLDATPPAEWGARFSLRGRFHAPALAARALEAARGARAVDADRLLVQPGDWRRWRGTLYAELPGVDVEPLQGRLALPFGLPFELRSGRGALRAWLDVREATLTGATVDVALHDLSLRLAPEEPALELAALEGRIAGGRTRDGGELRLQRLGFAAEGRPAVAPADLRLAWRRGADGALAGGELLASRLDLAELADLLRRVPPAWLPAGLRAQAERLAPRGVASGLELRWDGPPAAPRRWRLAAGLRGLALAAEGPGESEASTWFADMHRPTETLGRPGVEGLDLDLQASEAGGRARLALRDGALEFPGVFQAPRIPLERLDAELDWTVEPGRDGAPPRIELRTRGARLANADAAARFDAVWATGARRPDGSGRYPGVLDLTGQLTQADAGRVARYLPLGMGAEARRYLQQALLAGRVPALDFRVRGDLHDFPFAARGGARPAATAGEFRLAARLEGVRLAVQPEPERVSDGTLRHWPAFEDVSGELVIDRMALQLRQLQGRLAGVGSGGWRVGGVRGGIRDLAQPTLVLEGSGRGPLDDGLRFLAQSPLGDWLGGAFDATVAAGAAQAPVELQLALDVPLDGDAPARVRGSVLLAGNDLRLRPDLPAFGHARARVAFTERDFTLTGGRARTLGGELAFEGAMRPDGSLRFSGQGSASAEALRRSPELGAWTRVAGVLAGQTDYRLALGFVGGRPEWQLTSSLVGMSSGLPAPLGKAAAEPLPLRLQSAPAAAPGGAPREQLRLELGPDGQRLVEAQLLRESVAGGSRVVRGGLGVREAAPQPAEGVAVSVNLPRLDVDAWRRVAEDWSDGSSAGAPAAPEPTPGAPAPASSTDPGRSAAAPASAASAVALAARTGRTAQSAATVAPAPKASTLSPARAAAPAPTPSASSKGATASPSASSAAPAASSATSAAAPGSASPPFADLVPRSIALRADELVLAGRPLTRVVAHVARGTGAEAGTWRLTAQAAELEGRGEYRPDEAGGAGRVLARLSRLALPGSEAQAVSELLDPAPAAHTRVPALDLVVEDFELRGRRLGRLEVQAQNRPAAGWQLDRLRLATPDARFEASGAWAAAPGTGGRRRADMDFRLDILDGGALLARLGEPGLVQGAKGRMSGRIAWLGSPLEIDYPSLSGQMEVAIERGQFLQAEPGIAKLLGVLSLQSLPRRLLLDFRDLTQKGFAFDSVAGDVALAEGVASTGNLRMRGVQALVLVEGRADVARETQDLTMWVVPELNAGAASLAYAAINPAVGLGSFVAQWLLRRPLMEAGTRQFHVTGSWVDPKVERIERRPGSGLPAAADPLAEPASSPVPPVAPAPPTEAAPSLGPAAVPPAAAPSAAAPSDAAPSPGAARSPAAAPSSDAAPAPRAAAAPSNTAPTNTGPTNTGPTNTGPTKTAPAHAVPPAAGPPAAPVPPGLARAPARPPLGKETP